MMTDRHGKYGPRTAIVEKVLERAGRLTQQEARDLSDAWHAQDWDVWNDARYATENAVLNAAVTWDVAKVVEEAVWNAFSVAEAAVGLFAGALNAIGAAGDATLVAVVADLEGQQGLTCEHLEVLTETWRTAIKDVDPLEGIDDD